MLPAFSRNRFAVLALGLALAAGCGDRKPKEPPPFARIEDAERARTPSALAHRDGTLWLHAVTFGDDPAQDGSSSLTAIAGDGAVRVVAPSLPYGYAVLGTDPPVVAAQMGRVWRVDPASGAASTIADLGAVVRAAVASSGGAVIAHVAEGGEALVRVDPATGETRRIATPGFNHGLLVAAGPSVFAASPVPGDVVELLPDDTLRERATAQGVIDCLTVTSDHLIWFRKPDPKATTWEIAAQPLAGGDTSVLATTPSGSEPLLCAADGRAVYFTVPGKLARLVPGGAVEPGPPAARVRALTVGDGALFWIEEAPGGWAVRREPISAGRR